MLARREASLFRNGRSQAVRIPREFELAGDRVTITKDGDRLILEATRRRTLAEVLDAMEPWEGPDLWADLPDPPPEPFEL